MQRTPPDILITTPESLYLLLTSERARGNLREVRTVRWVVTHMIAETSRHLGHLDVLTELLDGRTGD